MDPHSPENLSQPSIKLDLTFNRYSGLTKDNSKYPFERIADNLLLEPRPDIPLLHFNSVQGVHKQSLDLQTQLIHAPLTLPEITQARIIPTSDDFAYWYNNPDWVPLEDEEPIWELSGFPDYHTPTRQPPSEQPSSKHTSAPREVLYSPALLKAIQQRNERKRWASSSVQTKILKTCRENSCPSRQQGSPRKDQRPGARGYSKRPRGVTKSCPEPNTPRTLRKRWTHSRSQTQGQRSPEEGRCRSPPQKERR